jgi:cyclopropane fatty-acyl-phospholipid synthase-like methyltransferase
VPVKEEKEPMDRFSSAYQGVPPWDIGRAQPEFVRLAEAGEIRGAVLDVGCGTGENALYLAGLGHEVWGVDATPAAIEKAQAKAEQRGVKATFLVGNALDLQHLGRTFDTIVDCGLFHALSDEERVAYDKSLAAALRPGGTYLMLCFSDRQPGTFGPRRVTQAEIRATFGMGWRVNYIREAHFDTNMPGRQVEAWLSSITRL